MTLGLTKIIDLRCDCGEEWAAEACTDFGACDFVYPSEANCPECETEGERA